ncbi:hypothetical protein BCR35DRAFT_305378 [Leucosporidium creatinivorum]|uniref:histidine kinase n=1 Tax=Leucosporidium creatinivorum TaxID=106004 RepID=A0A1Y2F2P0_9BASI|nr:hypothetical protein BCR35DRAFT_305378 [Leucosporidium creatinivorum]
MAAHQPIFAYKQNTSLPTPLLDYLARSPLPTLVLPFSIDSSDNNRYSTFGQQPLILNVPLRQLTRGKCLNDCLSEEGFSALSSWVGEGPPADCSTVANDISLDLRLGEEGSKRIQSIRWRKTYETENGLQFVALVALTFPPTRSSIVPALSTGRNPLVIPVVEERSSEERIAELELLYDRSQVGLARMDIEGRVISVNSAWWNITRYDRSQPIIDWARVIDPEDYEVVFHAFQLARQNEHPMSSFRFRLRTGEVLLGHMTPNSATFELATGWIMDLADITSQVKAEEAVGLLAVERERAVQQAKLLEEVEGRRKDAEDQKRHQELLIDCTSHEIRNPISAILQNAELTHSSLTRLRSTLRNFEARGMLPPELQDQLASIDDDVEAVESIGDCARAQEVIANDILGLAQIQLGTYSITPVQFDLSHTLRTIMRMFSTECRAKGIDLSLAFGPNLETINGAVSLMADPVRLSQIIINLLTNAIRFTASSPIRNITLSLEISPHPPAEGPNEEIVPPSSSGREFGNGPVYLYFAVADTGPSMTTSQARLVFERFMQASPITHVTNGGSGLGLWVARNLCELHGGRIQVLSTPGQGTIFRGFVTASSAQEVEEPIQLPSPAGSGSALELPVELLPPVGRRLRVLVVDDNQINRTILRRQLHGVGHEVEEARDGREALEKLSTAIRGGLAYDCCLMDVEMPVLDGVSATRQWRELESQQNGSSYRLRIVGCTGNAREGQIRTALESGMDALCTKPYKLADLIQKLAPA